MTSELDELLGPQNFHSELQGTAPAKASAQRSAVDDVIEAVGGIEPKKRVRTCPECEGTDFAKRKPFGAGTISYKCGGCGFLMRGPAQSSAKVVVEKAQINPQASGPYYSSTGLKPAIDKHAPKYRTKSKSNPRKQ
jgi:ribosomal protein L37AE/L43A